MVSAQIGCLLHRTAECKIEDRS